MIIETTKREEYIIAKFINIQRFTLAVTEKVKDELKPLLANKGSKLILDLKEIDFIDSSGIGCIISLVKAAKCNSSSFIVCNLSQEVLNVFELLHLQMVVNMEQDIESSIKKLNQQ